MKKSSELMLPLSIEQAERLQWWLAENGHIPEGQKNCLLCETATKLSHAREIGRTRRRKR